MKKSMLIPILIALLSSCGAVENTQETAEIPIVQTTQITSISTTAVTTEIAEITTVEVTATTAKIQSEMTVQSTDVINQQKEKNQENLQNNEQNTDTKTADDNAENPIYFSESTTENTTKKSAESTQTETVQSTENTPISTIETAGIQEETQHSVEPTECSLSDYEKALEVYNFMTENGSGTCVQYAYQTYEMCREYGLECYFAWTENRLYGHVANVVKIGDIWYVLDTQAGCFLTENMCGFTEIVDENENHIANADIISDTRY